LWLGFWKVKKNIIPGPGGAFRDEVIAGDDELGDAENAFLFEGRDRTRPCDPLHRSFEGFVKLLRQNHLSSLSIRECGKRGKFIGLETLGGLDEQDSEFWKFLSFRFVILRKK
jgi:hypothetical protein